MGNGERIRQAYDALNAGDPSVFLEMYDPEIELYAPSWATLEAGMVRGAKEVERYYGQNFAQWDLLRYEIENVVEWGPHVAVFATWAGEGRRSRIPAQSKFLSVFSFDEGRIVSIAQLGGVASS